MGPFTLELSIRPFSARVDGHLNIFIGFFPNGDEHQGDSLWVEI